MSSSLSAIGPDLRNALVAMVRKRVPESEVEDVVQSALAEAVESPHAPAEPEALRRWIFGVAKNKVVDYHRRAGRLSYELPELEGKPAPHVEVDMLRWAEKNLPEGDDAQKTLDWMLREGEGEKLESIATSEKVPAPRVRQRVSRLRRHLKQNWQKEVALLAAVGVLISAIVFLLLKKREPEPIAHDPIPLHEKIRKDALGLCERGEWKKCVDGLDEAKRLDPAGDTRPEVVKARDQADRALTPPPPPAPSPSDTDSKIEPPTKDLKTATPSPRGSGTPPAPKFAPKPESTAPVFPTKPAPAGKKPTGKTGKNSDFGSDFGSSDFGGSGSSSNIGGGSQATPAPPSAGGTSK
jgi:DNA-directed RNA polymerase specialized sigma24 family protein